MAVRKEEVSKLHKVQRLSRPACAPILQCVPRLGTSQKHSVTVPVAEVVVVGGKYEFSGNGRIGSRTALSHQPV
jgi:hypothetical protein